MSNSETYNGWCNHETWLANLWLSNDRDSQSLLMDARVRSEDIYEQAEWLEQQLRTVFDDSLDEASLWWDLLFSAFDRIDWVELVTNNT